MTFSSLTSSLQHFYFCHLLIFGCLVLFFFESFRSNLFLDLLLLLFMIYTLLKKNQDMH